MLVSLVKKRMIFTLLSTSYGQKLWVIFVKYIGTDLICNRVNIEVSYSYISVGVYIYP